MLYDVFLSHASEDKDGFVRPLAQALEAAGVAVWYDESALQLGDSLRQAIDRGLSKSRHGIIILSQAFFSKQWPQWELNALVARQMSGRERVIVPVWHGVDKEAVLTFSPALADLVAIQSSRGITAVCQAITRVVRPQGSPLVVAREELLAYGHTPPVITDEWWLDVVEASNRLTNVGAVIPERSHWGRWSFPLPNEDGRGDERGVRLAWTAMQLHWVQAAEEQKITQITSPPLVLRFIDTMAGLADICREFPSWLAAYAPQLVIPGLGGEFEAIFDELRDLSPAYDELMFRLPPEQLNPAAAACQFVQGALWRPKPKYYEAFDYLIWLLSDDSGWLPDAYRLVLQQGMKEWTVWLRSSRSGGDHEQERFMKWLRTVDAMHAVSIPPDIVPYLRREVAFSASQLNLKDDVNTLLERFLSGEFLEAYVRDRNGAHKNRPQREQSQLQASKERPILDRVAIYCADVGSVAGGRFGWASSEPDAAKKGGDILQLTADVARSLNCGQPVALGFECPLFIPLAAEPNALTSAREGEGNRAWSAGAGAGALATGLAQVTWILREIRHATSSECTATFDWNEFSAGRASLYLWEAFVSGTSKRGAHAADAHAALEAFRKTLSQPMPKTAIKAGPETYSLIGAAVLRSGWSNDVSLLGQACMVIRAEPKEGQ